MKYPYKVCQIYKLIQYLLIFNSTIFTRKINQLQCWSICTYESEGLKVLLSQRHQHISVFTLVYFVYDFNLPFWDPCWTPLLWQVSGHILVEALSNLLSDAKLLEERQEAAKQAYHALSCGITENVWSFLDFHIFRIALANKGLMLWIPIFRSSPSMIGTVSC